MSQIWLKIALAWDIISNMSDIDKYDLAILKLVQQDALLSMDAIAEKVHLSRNAVWRRLKALQSDGTIKANVAVVDPEKVGCGLTALVFVRTSQHEQDWLDRFHRAVKSIAHIVEAYRMSGDLDYMLKVRVADMKAYDRFYKRLIAIVPLSDVSASFVMEELKDSHRVPLEPI